MMCPSSHHRTPVCQLRFLAFEAAKSSVACLAACLVETLGEIHRAIESAAVAGSVAVGGLVVKEEIVGSIALSEKVVVQTVSVTPFCLIVWVRLKSPWSSSPELGPTLISHTYSGI